MSSCCGVECAAISFIERLTGKAGFAPSSIILASIFSAISKRGIWGFMIERAYSLAWAAIWPAFFSASISSLFIYLIKTQDLKRVWF